MIAPMPPSEVRRLAERFTLPEKAVHPAPDSYREMRRAENRRCMNALRAKRRLLGLCPMCGAEKPPGSTFSACADCRGRKGGAAVVYPAEI